MSSKHPQCSSPKQRSQSLHFKTTTAHSTKSNKHHHPPPPPLRLSDQLQPQPPVIAGGKQVLLPDATPRHTHIHARTHTRLLRHPVQPLSAAQRRDEAPKRLSTETEKLNRWRSHSSTLRRLLYFTKWQRHFKSSLTSMQEETNSITLESRTCQTLKLEKYLQLQNGRRERGHAWEGGVAHPLPGSTCFLSSTAPSLYLLCASSFSTHSLSSSSSVSSSPLLAAVVIPSSSPCPGFLSQRVCVCVR